MIKDTLYFKYIQERDQAEIIENDFGFVTFKIVNKECFILNMYVLPEYRRSGNFSCMIKLLGEKALQEGCEFISGNIQMYDSGKNKTLSAALSVGFEIVASDINTICIIKKLNGGF